MAQSVKHKRSSIVSNGSPKLPTTSQLEVGEIAINFAEGYETLSTRNNNNGIATFSSDAALDKKYISSGAVVSAISAVTKTIEDDEYVIAQAFNDQNDRIEALEDSWMNPEDYYDKTAADSLFLPYNTPIPTESSIANSGFTKNRGNAKIFYGTCTGDSGYVNKTVICPEFTSEDLVKGALVFVTFTNTNTADTEDIKLGVNGTGFKPIKIQYAESNSISDLRYNSALRGNCTYLFSYDGENWLLLTTDSDRDTVPSMLTQAEAEAGTSNLPRTISAISLKRDIEYRMTQNQPDWSETATTSPSFIKNKPSLSSYFDDVEYDSNTKRINFKNNNSVIDYIDATDFIKDGMVSSVTVSNGNLVISFNTEAGREDIELALTQIFNPSNYYDKTTADGKFLSLSGGTMNDDASVEFTDGEYRTVTITPNSINLHNAEDAWRVVLDPSDPGMRVGGEDFDSFTLYSENGITNKIGSGTSYTLFFPNKTGTFALLSDIPIVRESTVSGWGFTKNDGTVTGVKMNGTTNNPTSGVVDLGTVITSHQDVSWAAVFNNTEYRLYGGQEGVKTIVGYDGLIYAIGSGNANGDEDCTLATTDQIPTAADIEGSGFTKNGITELSVNGSALTVSSGSVNINMPIKYYDIEVGDSQLNSTGITTVIRSTYPDFYNSVLSDLSNGVMPMLRVNIGGIVLNMRFQFYTDYDETLFFSLTNFAKTTTISYDSTRMAEYSDVSLVREDRLRIKLSQSGYTQSGVTKVLMNGNTFLPNSSGSVNLGTVLTAFTETDPTVPSWAKASTKPAYTANEVGALPTGTTLDGIADGTTRKLSNYSLTGHTHSEYFPASGGGMENSTSYTEVTADGISLEDNGGRYINMIPSRITLHDNFGKEITIGNWDNGDIRVEFDETSYLDGRIERTDQYGGVDSLYIPTGKTGVIAIIDDIPTTAAEVGAMATSERNNYLPTGTTLDGIADGTTRKLSNYSLTGHTHDNYSLTSHTHSNYSLTGHTHTAAEVGALPDTTDIPTQASIANSGFTKNAGTLTGVTINGTPATVSNGVASATVSGLPSVSASDNGKILQVVNGQWTLVTPTVIYTGNGTPDNLLGNNGDIYLQTS